MQVVVLLAFIVTLMLAEEAAPGSSDLETSGWRVALAVVMYLAGATALAAVNTAMSVRGVRRAAVSAGVIRRHNILAILTRCWLVGGLAGMIVLGYGQWAMVDLRLRSVPLVGKMLVLAPFVAALVMTLAMEYPFHRAVRRSLAPQEALAGVPAPRGWTLREFLGYNIRHHLLFIAVPVCLIILAMDLLRLLHEGGVLPPDPVGAYVLAGGGLCAAGAVFLLAPLLIVRVWRTERLPPGALREELEDVCRSMGVRYRQIRIWRSGGVIANAGVMGVIGPVRYILLSDALLERMEDNQVRAIFAHEAGHIVSHHILYAVVFFVATAALCASIGDLLAALMGLSEAVVQAGTLALLAACLGLGFGWLSRRFERHSDVIAAWAVGRDFNDSGDEDRITPEGAAIFVRALERVAQLNGIPLRQRNWRHGSIAARVHHVIWLGSSAGTRRRIDRTVRRIKAFLWIGLFVALAVAAAVQRAFPVDPA